MVRCTHCQSDKPESEFHRHPRKINGLSSWCKPCARSAVQEWRARYRPAINQQRRDSYLAVLAIEREKRCTRCDQPFVAPAGTKRWVCDSCQRQRERARDTARQLANPRKGLWQRRRRKVLARDGWQCYLCHRSIPKAAVWPDLQSGTVDHVIPRSLGGVDTPDNLRAAHWICNRRKAASVLTEVA